MKAVSLARPEAILFDWDNTLIDNWRAIHEALNAALTAMGHMPWSYEETLLRVRESLRTTFPRMFGERWKAAREIFYAAYRARHLDTLRAIPGADETLARLAGAGLYLGVVSNKTGELLRRESTHLGWDAHLKRLVGAGDAKADKPAPDPVYMALKDGHIKPCKSVWFVGDAAIDIECARRTGCAAILVGDAPGEETAVARLGPESRISRLSDLIDLAGRAGRPI